MKSWVLEYYKYAQERVELILNSYSSLPIKTRKHAKYVCKNLVFLLFLLLQFSDCNHLMGCGSKDTRKALVFLKKVTCLTQFLVSAY